MTEQVEQLATVTEGARWRIVRFPNDFENGGIGARLELETEDGSVFHLGLGNQKGTDSPAELGLEV